MQITTIAQATHILRGMAPKHMAKHYTLDTVRRLLDFLGNPQEQFRAIHIAGTSGKTSTAYFTSSLLQAAGKRSGLTISPHMTSITERVQINGAPLPDAQFLHYLNQFLPLVASSGLEPTYFEVLVVLAYWVFAQEKIDYAVIETGLGGLLDGTNTIKRADKLCLITDIGLDHTEFLGNTITKIAEQKAGIIHPGNHVIMLPQSNKIMTVMLERAAAERAVLTVAHLKPAPDLPPYQRRNWSLALAAYEFLGLPELSQAQLAKAATHVPPGRMEVLTIGNKTVILDGAHNPQKLRALREALEARGIKNTVLLANLVKSPASKITKALRVLGTFTSEVIVPEFSVGQDLNQRHSLPAAEFAEQAGRAGIHATPEANLRKAVQLLLKRPEKTVVITGSLYLVSAARELLLDQT